MTNIYSKILEPKIIKDKNEGIHAVIHMPDMRTMLNCIYENKLFWENPKVVESRGHTVKT